MVIRKLIIIQIPIIKNSETLNAWPSSIKTTEIYTNVSMAKQNNIFTAKHPQNFMNQG